MIEAIISDFDGIIFDSKKFHFEALNKALKSLDLVLDYEIYQSKYVGVTDQAFFEKFLAANHSHNNHVSIKALIDDKILSYKNIIKEQKDLVPISGIAKFYDEVQKYISKFAVFSNGHHSEIELVLEKVEKGRLQKYFQFILTSSNVKEGKPEPDGYLEAAKRLGVSPENCLVLEDSKGGITAGKKAGMFVIALTTSHRDQELKEADFIADSYEDILIWIKKHHGAKH